MGNPFSYLTTSSGKAPWEEEEEEQAAAPAADSYAPTIISYPHETQTLPSGIEAPARHGLYRARDQIKASETSYLEPSLTHQAVQGWSQDPGTFSPEQQTEGSEPRWYESLFRVLEPFEIPTSAMHRGRTALVGGTEKDGLSYKAQREMHANVFGRALGPGYVLEKRPEARHPADPEASTAGGPVPGQTRAEAAKSQFEYEQDRQVDVDERRAYEERLAPDLAQLQDEIMEANRAAYDRFWEAASSGELSALAKSRAKDRVGPDYGILRQGDINDVYMPLEEAQRLQQKANALGLDAGPFLNTMADPTQRVWVGILGDVVSDPFNAAGPGAGTKVVRVGDDVFRAGVKAQAAAGAVSRATGGAVGADDVLRTIVAAERGDEAARAAAVRWAGELDDAAQASRARAAAPARSGEQIMDDAVRHKADMVDAAEQARIAFQQGNATRRMVNTTRANLDNAERALVRLKTPRYAAQVAVRETRLAAKSAAEQSAAARSLAFVGDGGRGLAGKAGGLPFHLPFTPHTVSLSPVPVLPLPKKAVTYAAGKVGAGVGKVAEPWTLRTLEATPWDEMTGSQMLAHLFQASGVEAARGVQDVGLFAWDTLARWFGDRTIMRSLRFYGLGNAGKQRMAAELGSELARDAAAADRVSKSLARFGINASRLARVSGEVWDNYQTALIGFMRRMSSMESETLRSVNRITEHARAAWKHRKDVAARSLPGLRTQIADLEGRGAAQTEAVRVLKAEATMLTMWASPKYGVQDVLIEAGGAIERGHGTLQESLLRDFPEYRGELGVRPELIPLANEVEGLIKRWVAATGQEEETLRQALVAMERSLKGDPRVRGGLEKLKASLQGQLDTLDQATPQIRKQLSELEDKVATTTKRSEQQVVEPVKQAEFLETKAGQKSTPAMSKRLREAYERGDDADDAAAPMASPTAAASKNAMASAVAGDTSAAYNEVRQVLNKYAAGDVADKAIKKSLDTLAERVVAHFDEGGPMSGLGEAYTAAAAQLRVTAGRRARMGELNLKRAVTKLDEGRTAGKLLLDEADATRATVEPQLMGVMEKLEETTPVIYLKTEAGKLEPRALHDFEEGLWTEYHQLTERIAPEDRLLLAYSVLRDTVDIPVEIPTWQILTDDGYRVLGRRMGDLPKELVPVVVELRRLIKNYEVLYQKHGFDFMADPLQMARSWGVTEYVPHIRSGQSQLSGQGGVDPGLSRHSTGVSLDERLSLSMDAARRREMEGTIDELNAGLVGVRRNFDVERGLKGKVKDAARRLKEGPDPEAVFTLDPMKLASRYMQANRAISTRDLLTGMMRSDVIRVVGPERLADGTYLTVHRIAQRDDLAPLMVNRNQDIDNVLLMEGTREEWLAQGGGFGAKVEELRHGGVAADDDPGRITKLWTGQASTQSMANLRKEVRELQDSDNLLEALTRIRGRDFSDGSADWRGGSAGDTALYDPRAQVASALQDAEAARRRGLDALANQFGSYDEIPTGQIKALDKAVDADLAKGLDHLANEINRLQVMSHDVQAGSAAAAGIQAKVTGRTLANFYTPGQELYRLYVPRVVQQSMEDMLLLDRASGFLGKFGHAVHAVQNFYKARMTILAPMFHGRNAISNVAQNMLDLGVHGALNPHTNVMATRLTHGLTYYEMFGSMENARKALAAPRRVTEKQVKGAGVLRAAETEAKYRIRQARAADFELSFGQWLDEGVDITGKGDVWTLDELYAQLKLKGAVSESFTQFVDLEHYEGQLLREIARSARPTPQALPGRIGRSLWDNLSTVEDVAIVYTGLALSGGTLMFLPKKLGAHVGRAFENQARLTNVLGNLKRSGNLDDAIGHANRFLFDYNDLNATQRVILRAMFPFLTWNMKNVDLQLRMMAQDPNFYSQFHRMMNVGLPKVSQAMEHEASGAEGPFNPKDYGSRYYQSRQRPYTLSRARIPIPGSSFFGRPLPNTFVSGFGLPQEALVEWMAPMLISTGANLQTLSNVPLPIPGRGLMKRAAGALGVDETYMQAQANAGRNPNLRAASHTNFLARIGFEALSGHHSFYDMPIEDMNNGMIFAAYLAALENLDPVAGFDPAGSMADWMKRTASVKPFTAVDPITGHLVERAVVDGRYNWGMGILPWNRIIREAASMSAIHALTLGDTNVGEGSPTPTEVPKPLRFLHAYTGIKLFQEQPWLGYQYGSGAYGTRGQEQALEEFRSSFRESTRTYGSEYLPKPR